MRNRLVYGAGLGATVAVIALSAAPVALARDATTPLTHMHTTPHPVSLPASGTCYDQTENLSGDSWISSKFGDDHSFDDQGADDFTLTKRCKVTQVVAVGIFPGAPAISVNVVLYADNDGVPGRAVQGGKQMKNTFTWTDQGTLDVTLKHKVTLQPGTYWVSVQPNVSDGSDDWLWATVSNQTGAPAMWKNPRGGFQLGCETYTPLGDCAIFATGPDDAFAVLSS